MAFYQAKSSGWLIRLGGVAGLALAIAAALALRSRATAGGTDHDLLAYLLAIAAFLWATGGAAMTAMGEHLFDPIEVARPWSRLGEAEVRHDANQSGCQGPRPEEHCVDRVTQWHEGPSRADAG